MRRTCQGWGGLTKCDYCASPAMYEFGTREMPGYSCDAHWDVARQEYEEDGGEICAIWSYWTRCHEIDWWRRYQRWLVYNMPRRGLS